MQQRRQPLILKLCPEKDFTSTPALDNASRRCVTSSVRESGLPSLKIKSGPGSEERNAK